MTVKTSLFWTVPVNVLLSNTSMHPNHRRFPAPLPEWFLLTSRMEIRTSTETSTTTRMLHPECTNGASSSVRILQITSLQGIWEKICSERKAWEFGDSKLGVGLKNCIHLFKCFICYRWTGQYEQHWKDLLPTRKTPGDTKILHVLEVRSSNHRQEKETIKKERQRR